MYIVGIGRTFFWMVLCLIAVVVLVAPAIVSAQTQVSDRAGLSISPATYPDPGSMPRLDPGETDGFTLRINNLENRDRTLYLVPRNISGVGAGGVPIFADDDELTGFELASWIELSADTVEIAANGTASVDVLIQIPEDAPPGSHFGGISVTSRGEQMQRTGAGVNYGVTNIVTVLVDGDLDERAMIRALSTDRFVYGSTDVEFTARVENMGNVLQSPLGPLEITNMFGAKVAQLTVNESRARVLPRTERVFTVKWQDENPGFGRYEATLSMAYGSEGATQTMSNTVSFWILPMNIIGPALLTLAALLLITFIGVRMYVRRTLSYHLGRSGRVARGGGRSAPFPFWLLALVIMLAVTALFLLILLAIFA